MSEIRTVIVVGCGVIGMGWATLFLAHGLRVIITDPAEGAEERFEQCLKNALPLIAAREELDALAKNYQFVKDVLPILVEADFVQENGPERVEWKEELLGKLDKHTRTGVVIASSSSGLPSSAFIGKCHVDPNRVLIRHPFNPPHLIPLVEVVPHPSTSQDAIQTALTFYKSLGKKPILLHKEIPGFVSNRLQAAINNEGYSLISRGIVSAEDLDAAVTSGPGLRWALTGPIATNALGGGGGVAGFANRISRLGSSIKNWEEDMLRHRFDWNEEALTRLQDESERYLRSVDWPEMCFQGGFNKFEIDTPELQAVELVKVNIKHSKGFHELETLIKHQEDDFDEPENQYNFETKIILYPCDHAEPGLFQGLQSSTGSSSTVDGLPTIAASSTSLTTSTASVGVNGNSSALITPPSSTLTTATTSIPEFTATTTSCGDLVGLLCVSLGIGRSTTSTIGATPTDDTDPTGSLDQPTNTEMPATETSLPTTTSTISTCTPIPTSCDDYSYFRLRASSSDSAVNGKCAQISAEGIPMTEDGMCYAMAFCLTSDNDLVYPVSDSPQIVVKTSSNRPVQIGSMGTPLSCVAVSNEDCTATLQCTWEMISEWLLTARTPTHRI
ncbi:hypothetical protein KCU98_g6234, partial [Aureobasidium melanogenum]